MKRERLSTFIGLAVFFSFAILIGALAGLAIQHPPSIRVLVSAAEEIRDLFVLCGEDHR